MTTSVRPTAPSEVRDAVRAAGAHRQRLRIAGAGTWLDAGRPVEADETLHLDGLSGIIEYEPGDLTLTALAGTRLDEIERATRANGQFLALDPFGAPEGTLGATLATASAGPIAHAFGAPRDTVLGLECITGDGLVVQGGGRVVKNVAGFDLVRLMTGAWGTLAVLTSASVRLRALPDVDRTLTLALDSPASSLDATLAELRTASIAPWCAEVVNASLARKLGLEPRSQALLRLAGNAHAVEAQLLAINSIGGTAALPDDIWNRLRQFEDVPATSVVRLSGRPSRLARAWAHALDVAGDAWVHATLGRGIVRIVSDDAMLGTTPFDGTTIVERLPRDRWDDIPPPAIDPISLALRMKFDPHGILNPGILGHP